MTPATLLNPQGKDVEPWNRVGVHAFDVDAYTSAAILLYTLRREFESTVGHLPYVMRGLM